MTIPFSHHDNHIFFLKNDQRRVVFLRLLGAEGKFHHGVMVYYSLQQTVAMVNKTTVETKYDRRTLIVVIAKSTRVCLKWCIALGVKHPNIPQISPSLAPSQDCPFFGGTFTIALLAVQHQKIAKSCRFSLQGSIGLLIKTYGAQGNDDSNGCPGDRTYFIHLHTSISGVEVSSCTVKALESGDLIHCSSVGKSEFEQLQVICK